VQQPRGAKLKPLASVFASQRLMAHPEGFEPPTF
jgi:hypothetical protein